MKKELKNIKILATVGPSSIDKEILQRMESAGVDIFRINLSHTKEKDFNGIFSKISSSVKKTICVDSEGAQIRTGKMKNGQAFLENNSVVSLSDCNVLGDEKNIPLYPISPKNLLKEGDILYMDFHNVIVQVIEISKGKVKARVLEGGVVGSNKGVNLDRDINLPAFTEKDMAVFKMAEAKKIDCIALSFCSKKEDVENLRKIFKYPIFAISKIESRKGINNLEEICKVSDAILIDRGDLSRDVQLQKIGLVQKHILKTAGSFKTPVYVATNLLETMMENFQPTRAEVNDITNTLLDGAQGLVLAAETAIGKHPAECVRMVKNIIEEVKNYKQSEKNNYLNSIFDYSLIEPHGGILVQNIISLQSIKNIGKLKKKIVSDQAILDLVQIGEGVYSPLRGFMNYKELTSVLENYKLKNGAVWTMPILLQMEKSDINFKEDERIILQNNSGEICGAMDVSEIKKIDIKKIAEKWFGSKDDNHPGASNFKKKGNYIIGGEVFLIQRPASYAQLYNLTPKQTREIFGNFGWQKIVGFHTRNVVHKGHEFIQKEALAKVGADSLFISPVVGPKKADDFTAEAIIGAYEIMIKKGYYKPYPAIIGSFATYSRYSGPREAVFTALCRKNFGCSHFIVGRDHTGVGNYYSPNASQEIFSKIGDIGIIPLFFDVAYFCRECGKVVDKCRHKEKSKISISGTKARACLLNNEKIPDYLMRPDIAEMLEDMYKNSKNKLFETGQ
ncbi:MAG: sulfate adenylyltransferase [Candidatus Staskawiczbacteria bacterium]|nr:sulfate adenylyltransferase [Candidatus Staskawiczbacteria bacterium]